MTIVYAHFFPLPIVPTEVPANVTVVESTATTMSLSWAGITCGVSSGGSLGVRYKYELRLTSDDTLIASDDITSTSVTIDALTAGTDYTFRVAASNDAGRSGYNEPPLAVMTVVDGVGRCIYISFIFLLCFYLCF